MRYGGIEWEYAAPIADALVASSEFRGWLLKKTRFAHQADQAILLHREMKARRSANAETWWRSYFTEKCRCQGCSGQETDMLAIFMSGGARFALHIEIKQPKDRFPTHKDQARNYGLRAACWAHSAPASVLEHEDADTVLVYAEKRRFDYSDQLKKFGAAVTFEEISSTFEEIAKQFPSPEI
ncbi:MAG: hypothetical protein RIC87_23615 [Kiloniellales bacterium]